MHTSPSAPLKGKVALVTGASSGIGAAIAARLCHEGLKVAMCARRTQQLESLRDELEKAGGSAFAQTTDMRNEADILALFEGIRDQWGGVDILVNNAGLGHRSPLMSGDTSHWREMLEVNVLALCICTREAIDDMRRRGDDGHIIHLSSMSGHRVPANSGVYSASKFAVRSLTEGLRQELRAAQSKIRVTAISPGFVETEFAEKYDKSKEMAQKVYSRFPVLQSEDIASSVWHALSQPPYVAIHDILIRSTEQTS